MADGPALGSGSLTLHLGVLVQPYRAMQVAQGRRVSALTTADVARFLEARYDLMATFYRVRNKDVIGAIENSIHGSLESLLMGQRVDPWGNAMQSIQSAFKDFINSKQAETVGIPGTPTKAALRGVNHRYKHPYMKRNPRRPSFRDTGLYVGSFRAWVD